MYATIRRDFYWSFMANDAYQVVKDCRSCAAPLGTIHKHQKLMSLFSAAGRLEFIAMDILVLLSKTTQGNWVIFVITD